MKIAIYILATLFVLGFFLSNLTYLNNYLPQCYPYIFSSDQGRYQDYELGKGHDPLGRVEVNFENYKVRTDKRNLVLHRRFYRRWWQVWNWIDFLTHPRWDYPYAANDQDT